MSPSPYYLPRSNTTPKAPTPPGILDSHFHIITDKFINAVKAAGDDPAGYLITEWSPEEAISAMNARGVARALLSFTSPGPLVGGVDFVRQMNRATKRIVESGNGRFGWYASLPNWNVTGEEYQAVIREIEWALSEGGADGIVVMTSYGDKLLGDPKFKPIWDKLDELHAVVFIHPSEVAITPRFIGTNIPQPLIDYPLASTRTAVDLIVTKTIFTHPNVKVILSHGGGALPFLAERVITLSSLFGLSEEQCRADMRRFYLDLALCTSRAQLKALLEFADPSHIIYASDWPYNSLGNTITGMNQLQTFIQTDPDGKKLKHIWRENMMKLFGWR